MKNPAMAQIRVNEASFRYFVVLKQNTPRKTVLANDTPRKRKISKVRVVKIFMATSKREKRIFSFSA